MNIYSLTLGCESPQQNRNLWFGITVPQQREKSARFGVRDEMLSSHGSRASAAHSHRAARDSGLKEKKSHWEALKYFFQDSFLTISVHKPMEVGYHFQRVSWRLRKLDQLHGSVHICKGFNGFQRQFILACFKFIINVLLIPPHASGKDSPLP